MQFNSPNRGLLFAVKNVSAGSCQRQKRRTSNQPLGSLLPLPSITTMRNLPRHKGNRKTIQFNSIQTNSLDTMIPSLHFVSNEDLVLPYQVYLSMMVATSCVVAVEANLFAQAAGFVLSAYVLFWLNREWSSFDDRIHQDCGAYIPIEDEIISNEETRTPPSPMVTLPRVSSCTSLSDRDRNNINVWSMVLASGAPF